MTAISIKRKIFDYINNADDRILKAVYAMLKEYEETPGEKSALSNKQYEVIEGRWKNYKTGKSKTYTIAELRKRLQK